MSSYILSEFCFSLSRRNIPPAVLLIRRFWSLSCSDLETPADLPWGPGHSRWAWSQYCPQTVLRLASRELNCSQHHLWIVLSDWVMIPGETLVSFTPRIYLPILLKTLHCWGCLYLGFKANFLPLNSYMYWCIDDGGHNIEIWLIHVHHRFLLPPDPPASHGAETRSGEFVRCLSW